MFNIQRNVFTSFQAYILCTILFIGGYYLYKRTWLPMKHKLVIPNFSKPKKTVYRAVRPGGPKGGPKS